jgi:hypothetical protein
VWHARRRDRARRRHLARRSHARRRDRADAAARRGRRLRSLPACHGHRPSHRAHGRPLLRSRGRRRPRRRATAGTRMSASVRRDDHRRGEPFRLTAA